MNPLAGYYEEYWQARVREKYLYVGASGERARLAYEFLALRLAGDARVLDLGCGEGHFGKAARGAGARWRLVGADVAPTALGHAAPFYDEVFVLDAEADGWENALRANFDAVVCMEVLEHLVAPEVVISKLRVVVAPGGWLVASFPNFAFWRNRFRALQGVFPERQLFAAADHLHYFTLATFRDVFARAGWEGGFVGGLFETPRFTRRLLQPLMRRWRPAAWAKAFAYQIVLGFRPRGEAAEVI